MARGPTAERTEKEKSRKITRKELWVGPAPGREQCRLFQYPALNKRILRFILGDYSSPYSSLLKKINSTSLANKRIQNFLILLYKSLFFPHFPAYMKNMFSLRSSFYDLRGNNILSLCKPRTTSFGLSSFSYFSAKQWNTLPDCIRTSDFTEFKRNIQGMTFV